MSDVIDIATRRKRAPNEVAKAPERLTGRSTVPDLSIVFGDAAKAVCVFVPNARSAQGWCLSPEKADELGLELIRFAEQARIEQDEASGGGDEPGPGKGA